MKKSVGNAVRTKSQIRSSKAKGSSLEYDVQYNLTNWTDRPVTRTSERGFQKQYDIAIGEDLENPDIVIECKRLKGISWNQLVKFYEKLVSITPKDSVKYVIFQSNRQPPLVFYKLIGSYLIREFNDVFSPVKFVQHAHDIFLETKWVLLEDLKQKLDCLDMNLEDLNI